MWLTIITYSNTKFPQIPATTCDPDVKIVPVAIRTDNYAYLIIDKVTQEAAVVDPSGSPLTFSGSFPFEWLTTPSPPFPMCTPQKPDPKAVLDTLAVEGDEVKLTAILTTHKHWDHSAGNARLLKLFPTLRVYGSAIDATPSANQKVYDGDEIRVGRLLFRGLESRVHTKGHILYLLDQPGSSHPPALFSGDAVFIAGAGRFFESTAAEFYQLVQRLGKLNPLTTLFPGHEYALANLKFAETLDQNNSVLQAKLGAVRALRATGLSTTPSTLQEEFLYNPFFRSSDPRLPR